MTMKSIIPPELLNIQFCPSVASTEFYELLLQFGINLAILLILSRAMYFKWNRHPEYMFAQLITGVIVFMICALLRWVQLELGLVLGLFAIFAIIRFRTINVPVKEMAYLFMIVGISAVNALLPMSNCLQWIIFANIILVAMTFIMEKVFFSNKLSDRTITFNNTELLKPSRHQSLLQELKELTELDIVRFEIGKVDYVKKHALIRIYFKGDVNGGPTEFESANDDD
jgi:predicted membrane channel-forming protein YqfA (hemolysin III family)